MNLELLSLQINCCHPNQSEVDNDEEVQTPEDKSTRDKSDNN